MEKYESRIRKYDMDGNYICTYPTIIKAAEYMKKFSSVPVTGTVHATAEKIFNACEQHSSVYHYQWRYAEETHVTKNIGSSERIEKSRAVNQYKLNGMYLATFQSISEAVKAIRNLNKEEISDDLLADAIEDCCNQKRIAVYNFQWRYTDECKGKESICGYYIKYDLRVNQYALDGTYLNTFDSTVKAGRSIGKNNLAIYQACTGKQKTAYGYQWRYVRDVNGTENIEEATDKRYSNRKNSAEKNDCIQEDFERYLSVIMHKNIVK